MYIKCMQELFSKDYFMMKLSMVNYQHVVADLKESFLIKYSMNYPKFFDKDLSPSKH